MRRIAAVTRLPNDALDQAPMNDSDDHIQYRRSPAWQPLEVNAASTFPEWVGERRLVSQSTNAGARVLPFQSWHRFKEAFSPELVAQAVRNSSRPVRRICDPFGGSGTTSLAAQFLGIESVAIEVNPFLADLIKAKVAKYRASELTAALSRVVRRASRRHKSASLLPTYLPPTFVQPGVKDRWLFDLEVALEVFRLVSAIEQEENPSTRRLFRVLLGGLLVEFSNAVVSGKGRRYRRRWSARKANPSHLITRFAQVTSNAIVEIEATRGRDLCSTKVLVGDCLKKVGTIEPVDLVVSSPPYPNSFDYTDVYNIELWMLNYLRSPHDNRNLRASTLSSHVQVARQYADAPKSPLMLQTMNKLKRVRHILWNDSLVEMVGGYFGELETLLRGCKSVLRVRGQIWLVVGDSQYANVQIRVADILEEIGGSMGLTVARRQPFRSMRLSPQQGGSPRLAENLVVFTKT